MDGEIQKLTRYSLTSVRGRFDTNTTTSFMTMEIFGSPWMFRNMKMVGIFRGFFIVGSVPLSIILEVSGKNEIELSPNHPS